MNVFIHSFIHSFLTPHEQSIFLKEVFSWSGRATQYTIHMHQISHHCPPTCKRCNVDFSTLENHCSETPFSAHCEFRKGWSLWQVDDNSLSCLISTCLQATKHERFRKARSQNSPRSLQGVLNRWKVGTNRWLYCNFKPIINYSLVTLVCWGGQCKLFGPTSSFWTQHWFVLHYSLFSISVPTSFSRPHLRRSTQTLAVGYWFHLSHCINPPGTQQEVIAGHFDAARCFAPSLFLLFVLTSAFPTIVQRQETGPVWVVREPEHL